MTPDEKLDHYRFYMKIYGLMILELADDNEEIPKLIKGENFGPLMVALKDRIENSPVFG